MKAMRAQKKWESEIDRSQLRLERLKNTINVRWLYDPHCLSACGWPVRLPEKAEKSS